MGRAYTKYMAIILTFLFAFSVISSFIQTPVAIANENQAEDKKILIANAFIQRVSDKINSILSLAEEYNIQIPDNLSKNIMKANDLLDNASRYVETEPIYAIKLAIRASIVFAPVARYVIKNLPPEVIENARNNRLKQAIEVKLIAVEKLNRTVQWLENMSIPVPDEIQQNLQEAKNILQNAQNKVNSSNYNVSEVAHMIAYASKLIGQTTMLMYKYTSKIWICTSLADRSLHRISIATVGIDRALNKTIDALQTGNISEAKEKLSTIINVTDRLVIYLDKAIEISTNRSGSESNFTQALTILKESLIEAKTDMENAYQVLENNPPDTLSAVSYLENSLITINQAIEDVAPIFKRANHYLIITHDVLGRMRLHIKEKIIAIATYHRIKLVICLEVTEARLKFAYQLYEKGKITAGQLNNTLTATEHMLNNVLNALNSLPNPPQPLINKINNLLSWIEEVRAEIST